MLIIEFTVIGSEGIEMIFDVRSSVDQRKISTKVIELAKLSKLSSSQ